MSVYSNVNYSKLQRDVNTALNELNSYDEAYLIGNIRGSSALSYSSTPNCKTNINNAAKDICNLASLNGSINNLKKKLNQLKTVAAYIKCIQELEYEINHLEMQLYDEEGNININIKNRINSKKQSIRNYESMI